MRSLLFLIVISWANLAQAELRIADAWIKHLPPTVPVRAGYMTLTNDGDANVSVVAARSAAFASVEIHETLAKDGMTLKHGKTSLELTASGVTVDGAKVAIDGDSVTLGRGASASLLNADLFLTMLGQHVHPVPGGSSLVPPPIPLATVALNKVKGV